MNTRVLVASPFIPCAPPVQRDVTGNALGGTGVQSAAPQWCSEGEMPTATATIDGPQMRAAFEPCRVRRC
jgi:hypothetical protein